MSAVGVLKDVLGRVRDWLLIAALVAVAVMGFLTLAPLAETRLFPVLDSMTITRVEADGPNATKVWFRFDKHRACPPAGVFWFRGSRNGLFEPVRFTILPEAGGTYVNRPMGLQLAGPWRVELPLKDVLERSFADAQHNCFPWWISTSEMWTGASSPQAPPQ